MPHPPAPSARIPFVGRVDELTTILRSVEDLVAGQGGCVVVSGEPGIGKTRLIEELARLAGDRGASVLSGHGAELEADVPYALFREALGTHVKTLHPEVVERLTSERVAELGLAFPILIRIEHDYPRPLAIERYRLHDAIRRLLEDMARERPLVLLLDDVHWADDASAEVIRHLLARPPEGRILVAVTYRDPQVTAALSSALATAVRAETATPLHLGALSSSEAADLLGDRFDRETSKLLYEESGGNPFYLSELSRRADPKRRPASEAPDPWPAESVGIPRAVAIAIADELGRISRSTLPLLQAAAVVGEPFDPELAAAVAELTDTDAEAALDELVDSELVKPVEPPGSFTFRNPVVRRAVYESLNQPWRVAAHARAASALADGPASQAVRAHHVQRSAQRGDQEAIAILESAGHASASRAPSAAARWFSAAIALLPDETSAQRRLELLTPLAVALGSSGRIAECRSVLTDTLAVIPLELRDQRAQLMVAIARLDHMITDRASAAGLLGAALGQARHEPFASNLRLELAVDRWLACDWDAMAAEADAVRITARSRGDGALAASATTLLALSEKERGETASALRHLDEARAEIDELPDDQVALRVETLAYLADVEYCTARHRDAVEHLERGLRIVRASGQELFFLPLITSLGLAHVLRGQLADARACSEAAVGASELMGDPSSVTLAQTLRAVESLAGGDARGAMEAGEAAATAARDAGATLFEVYAHCRVGEALVGLGAFEQARTRILEHSGGEELTLVTADLRPQSYAALAAAELGLGRLEAAEQWVAAAEKSAQRLGLPVRIADARRARAVLALATGQLGLAEREAAVAADTYLWMGQALDGAHADLVAGQALALSGDRQGALDRLESASAVFVSHGAASYADEAAARLDSLGRPPAKTRKAPDLGSGITSLSRREREVAELVSRGMTNREIAQELYLSHKTIESHLARTFKKLGISTRAGLARTLTRSPSSDQS
ncbi:MAG: helix-turn-helix transcriptional regulator [Solirubrobacteraceae bacterium]